MTLAVYSVSYSIFGYGRRSGWFVRTMSFGFSTYIEFYFWISALYRTLFLAMDAILGDLCELCLLAFQLVLNSIFGLLLLCCV